MGGAPQPHPASILGGAREAAGTQAEERVPLAVEDEGRDRDTRRDAAGTARRRCARRAARRRPTRSRRRRSGPAIAGWEAGPEEPRVERIERRPVEPIHDPGEGAIRRSDRSRPARRSRRTGPGRERAPDGEPRGPSPRSHPATGRRRPLGRRPPSRWRRATASAAPARVNAAIGEPPCPGRSTAITR